MDVTVIALTSGSWIILGVVLVMLAGLIYGFYTRGGSGISSHPRGDRRGGTAPGSQGPSEASGRDEGESAPVQHGTK